MFKYGQNNIQEFKIKIERKYTKILPVIQVEGGVEFGLIIFGWLFFYGANFFQGAYTTSIIFKMV